MVTGYHVLEERCSNFDFKVGDSVKVLSCPEGLQVWGVNEYDCDSWVDEMNNVVGKVCKIIGISRFGYRLEDGIGHYNYPFYCLKPHRDKNETVQRNED